VLLNRKGDATAVGGLFFLVMSLMIISLMMFSFWTHYDLSVKLLRKIEEARPEDAVISLEYTYLDTKDASVVNYTVTIGTVVDSGVNPLQTRGDGDTLVIESRQALDIEVAKVSVTRTTNFIRNGEFDEGFNYWTTDTIPPSPPGVTGNWTIATYNDGDKAARRITEMTGPAGGPGKKTQTATLSQQFSVEAEVTEATLSFNYLMNLTIVSGEQKEMTYNLKVKILRDGKIVFSDTIEYDDDEEPEWETATYDVTSAFTKSGDYTLIFEIEMRVIPAKGTEKYDVIFDTWIDKVELLITYIEEVQRGAELLPAYDAEIYFNVTVPNSYNITSKLLLWSNVSVLCRTYEWNSADNAWILKSCVYSTGNSWFNITLYGSRIRVYVSSPWAFKLELDYIEVHAYVLNTSGLYVTLKNTGSPDIRLIAVWVNETRYPNSGVWDLWVLSGEERKVSISHSLESGKHYTVKVITSKEAYTKSFDT